MEQNFEQRAQGSKKLAASFVVKVSCAVHDEGVADQKLYSGGHKHAYGLLRYNLGVQHEQCTYSYGRQSKTQIS